MNFSPNSLHVRGVFALGVAFGCGANTGSGDPESIPASSSNSEPASACAVDTSGSLVLSTQADVDALAGCASIEGSVYMQPRSGSLDLRSLSRLRRVGGQLLIGCNPYAGLEADCTGYSMAAVASLAGLEALEEAGALHLSQLGIRTLAPLARLRRVGFLGISACPGLTDLQGLGRFEQLEQLEILHNPNLQSLDGLEPTSTLLSVTLEANPALADIRALAGSTSRLERVALNSVPVADLSPLAALESLEDLSLGSTGLRSFDGLRLRSVGRLYVHHNQQLEQVDALGGLEAVNDITFIDNPRLARLPEFASITDLFSFEVFFNAALERGPSFPALKRSRSMSVTFQGNDALTSIDGLRALEVGGWLTVVENRALRALDLGSLVQIDSLRVLCNPALSAEALAPLQAVEGELFLPGNSTEVCP